MSDPKVEWASGPDLAEEAEALGIKTDQIIGARDRHDGGLLVLWSPEPMGDDDQILGSVLRPDADDILRVVKTGPTGATLGEFKRAMEEGVREIMERRDD